MALLWFYSNRLFCAHNAFHLIHLTIPHRDDKNDTSSNTQNCSPLKLAGKGPYGSTEQNFAHYRGIEVKHGRIAMAVTVGMLVQETSRFNTFVSPSANLKFTDIPNGLGSLKAFHLEGWVQIVMVIRAPLRNTKEDDSKRRSLTVEVTNGRLAMLGILDMFASEVINGQVLFEINNGIKFAESN